MTNEEIDKLKQQLDDANEIIKMTFYERGYDYTILDENIREYFDKYKIKYETNEEFNRMI